MRQSGRESNRVTALQSPGAIGAALLARLDGLLPQASCHRDRTWPAHGGAGGSGEGQVLCISWPQSGTPTPCPGRLPSRASSCRPLDLKKGQRIHDPVGLLGLLPAAATVSDAVSVYSARIDAPFTAARTQGKSSTSRGLQTCLHAGPLGSFTSQSAGTIAASSVFGGFLG